MAGFTVANDVSARDWQMKRNGKQWLLGKTFDSFCPLGPAIVTTDAVKGEMKQGAAKTEREKREKLLTVNQFFVSLLATSMCQQAVIRLKLQLHIGLEQCEIEEIQIQTEK